MYFASQASVQYTAPSIVPRGLNFASQKGAAFLFTNRPFQLPCVCGPSLVAILTARFLFVRFFRVTELVPPNRGVARRPAPKPETRSSSGVGPRNGVYLGPVSLEFEGTLRWIEERRRMEFDFEERFPPKSFCWVAPSAARGVGVSICFP